MNQTDSTVQALYNQALRHINNRELGPTQQTCLKILSLNKQHAGSHMLLGVVATEFGKLRNAAEFLDKAADLDHNSAEIWAQLARVRLLQKRNEAAQQAADRARELGTDSAFVWDTLGVIYSKLTQHEIAIKMFRCALNIQPDVASYWFNYGASLQFTGKIEQAEDAYETAIGLDKRLYKAHAALSRLAKQTKDQNHIARLQRLLDQIGDDSEGELHLRHALAKEHEDLEQYAASFEHLVAGKQRKRSQLGYDIKDDAAIFAEIARTFKPDTKIEVAKTAPVDEPIFVIGMPRTGTTLVERILTSHPSVHAAGEMSAFGLLLKRESGTTTPRVIDPETVIAAQKCNMGAVGKGYLKEGYRIAGLASRFVDKMPLNFLYVGFIHQALPNAKFVCLRRNPLDTVLSNFRQLFATNFSYYNYSFDLKDTARYYLMFSDLMERWQQLLPNHMLQVNYEELVADQERVTAEILEHCNLPWDDACLAFEKNSANRYIARLSRAGSITRKSWNRHGSRWKRPVSGSIN
jgi:tetratricopeptide (TPR) repeat protein